MNLSGIGKGRRGAQSGYGLRGRMSRKLRWGVGSGAFAAFACGAGGVHACGAGGAHARGAGGCGL